MTMDGYSQTPKEERLKILQSVMPEIFDEGKIDWEKLRAVLGEDVNFADERYRLNWAGKSDAFRVMQEASAATLVPCREESVDFDHTQNIFIEGENMEVLKVLQKSYFGKVKMIYIDPPYNTGNDSFIYPDRFAESREEYMRRVGDKDEDGYMLRDGMFRKNSKENGQYHSNWLNMMMPRLYLAKSLLREDGVIFVSIDDNEVHNLRLLMNEIFGEENFIAQLIWKSKSGGANDSRYFAIDHEYILVYAKNANDFSVNIDTEAIVSTSYNQSDEKGEYALDRLDKQSIRYSESLDFEIIGPDGQSYFPQHKDSDHPNATWRWGKDTVKERYEELVFRGGNVYTKNYKKDGAIARSLLLDERFGRTRTGKTDCYDLFNQNLFSNPKPYKLVRYLQLIALEKNSLILDFFAGSGTTAHAVMQLNREDGGNRRYICVQLPEPCDENSEAYKAGYKTIADIAKERIRRAGAKIRAEIEAETEKQSGQLDIDDAKEVKMPDLGFKVFKLADSNFKQWRKIRGSDTEAWRQQIMEFIDPVAENATVGNMVYELLLKSGKNLNSMIEHKNGYYTVNGRELILMLESATQETVDAVLAAHPEKVFALDRLFEGNDQLKTNTVLQMKDAGITFITI